MARRPRPSLPDLAPEPPEVPARLLAAFRRLGVEPILVGGTAAQVWAGRRDGVFFTGDLDLLAPIRPSDLESAGIALERSGRHAVVDGIPVEFPSGPLAVGDLVLDPEADVVSVPTRGQGSILCIRPEACTLDRLAWVAGDRSLPAYQQALGVAFAQQDRPGWNEAWMSKAAPEAGLGKLWRHLAADLRALKSGRPDPRRALEALHLGWD